MTEYSMFRALVIGVLVSTAFLFALGVYVKLADPIRHWIATFRMKSLFWKDRRRRKKDRPLR
jgi:hypothetical protein